MPNCDGARGDLSPARQNLHGGSQHPKCLVPLCCRVGCLCPTGQRPLTSDSPRPSSPEFQVGSLENKLLRPEVCWGSLRLKAFGSLRPGVQTAPARSPPGAALQALGPGPGPPLTPWQRGWRQAGGLETQQEEHSPGSQAFYEEGKKTCVNCTVKPKP